MCSFQSDEYRGAVPVEGVPGHAARLDHQGGHQVAGHTTRTKYMSEFLLNLLLDQTQIKTK